MVYSNIRFLLFFSICWFLAPGIYAQANDSAKKKIDSPKADFVTKMQVFAQKSAIKSAEEFDADRSTISQNKIFEEIKRTMQVAKIYLKTGVDLVDAREKLQLIDTDFEIAGDGVFSNQGSTQTFRNLTATSKILSELLSKSNSYKFRLSQHEQQLNSFRYQLDSLISIKVLFKFPKDSAVLARYIQRIIVVGKEIHPIDSVLKQAGANVEILLNQYSLQVLKLQASQEEISQYEMILSGNIFKKEFENIWESTRFYRPFGRILAQAFAKGKLTLFFYLQNNLGKLFFMIILVLASFSYLRSLRNIYLEKGLLESDFEGQSVLRYPILTAILIVINLFQFLFFSPPFILNVILWSVTSVCLTFLFKNYITRYWRTIWLLMVLLFLIAAFDNLILQASKMERWFMLVVSISGSVVGFGCMLKSRKEKQLEKWIPYSIALMTFLELSSTAANIFGRYNLSKTLLISGFLNVVIAILFLWTLRLINEGLYLAFNVYTQQDKKLFYLNFEKVGNSAPWLLYVLLVLGWIILFGRNFPGYEYASGPLLDVFAKERTIGDYTFNIDSLALFIAIISISVIISKIVSYFATDKHLSNSKEDKDRRGLGSWLLLVRISILSIGLFLAIAAAGIPVDRIAIVLGALGVGIGFGLQTLVNNLVSGLIIAFEKPVNVGDVVDVDGQGGTMKSIGFRSSVISTWEGADVVVPNGDLLNSHLTNWSLGGNKKRMFILIGIAYDSDLEKAKNILTDLLIKEKRIAQHPTSVVQYEQFNNSSIDVRIYFWTKNMKDSFVTRSDLIIAIKKAFQESGIIIPFPQQEIYLHGDNKGNIGN